VTCSVILGDCREVLKPYPDNTFDSIVTDPPYGLSFMGKEWDRGVPGVPFW
jgi:site-specific DNA-methyltransferase (adenine-specific)